MDIFGAILAPFKWLVSAIMIGFHDGLSFIGLPAANGWTWTLSIIGLVLVIRAALIPVFVKQIKAQRGMQLLQSGAIDAEAFVQLNEGIGSYTNDMDWTGDTASRPAARERAVASLLPRLYSSGLTSNGRNLSQVAIIDLRPHGTPRPHPSLRSGDPGGAPASAAVGAARDSGLP